MSIEQEHSEREKLEREKLKNEADRERARLKKEIDEERRKRQPGFAGSLARSTGKGAAAIVKKLILDK